MKKVMGLTLVFLAMNSAIQAQEGSSYKNAIGGRFGGGYYDVVAASYKTFLSDAGALELNLGFRAYSVAYNWFNLSFSASYQHHFPIGSVDGLRWFIGGGLTAYNSFSSYSGYSGFGLGVFPTGGVDYKFANIPLNVSADIRPTIGIIKPYTYYDSFYLGNVGAAVRYTF